MKNFIVQQKVNPTDNWKDYKKFDDKKKAIQSFEMLKKHVTNLLKDSEYMKYRVYDTKNKIYYP